MPLFTHNLYVPPFRVIHDEAGQTCNRFWAYVNHVAWAVKHHRKVYIIFWDKSIQDYDALRKNEYVSFPFYNRRWIEKYGDEGLQDRIRHYWPRNKIIAKLLYLNKWLDIFHYGWSDRHIDDYVDSWLDRRSFSTAGDLISAAITNGQRNNKYARDAARYITEEQNSVEYPVLERAAKYILSGTGNIISAKTSDAHSELIQKLESAQNMGKRIHDIRHKMNIYPYNAVLYVDMSRAQLTVGNTDKAIKLMQVALQLDPSNRLIG